MITPFVCGQVKEINKYEGHSGAINGVTFSSEQVEQEKRLISLKLLMLSLFHQTGNIF